MQPRGPQVSGLGRTLHPARVCHHGANTHCPGHRKHTRHPDNCRSHEAHCRVSPMGERQITKGPHTVVGVSPRKSEETRLTKIGWGVRAQLSPLGKYRRGIVMIHWGSLDGETGYPGVKTPSPTEAQGTVFEVLSSAPAGSRHQKSAWGPCAAWV